MRKSKLKSAVAALGTIALVAGLAACAPGGSPAPATSSSGGATAVEAPAEIPEADQFGVVLAESWKDIYPNQYETYLANESNSPEGKMDYLTEYPELVTMYAGYGFAKGYDEAASHAYTLQSVAETPRVNENTLANCITCKTPQYT
ncbi:MAG: ammonia-forming cytochrome c nitrite reductase subunit c552, partial [Eggerthellaceae bacterium]|nr:ammonia-forming cytochrome c nitrite reductase subunit c552 [Eggerthellaceae bacterium]